MRQAGWGNTLVRQETPESPLGGQLEKHVIFTYYSCQRHELKKFYVEETLRSDIWQHGTSTAYLLSACRLSLPARLLGTLFPAYLFWGRRDLIEIHVRR